MNCNHDNTQCLNSIYWLIKFELLFILNLIIEAKLGFIYQ